MGSVCAIHGYAGADHCFRPGLKSTRFVNAPLGYVYAGDSGCEDGGFPATWNQLAPRLGITYNPGGGKTVIRAGAGIFYQPPFMEQFNNMADSAPFSPQVQRFRVPFSNPYSGATNPFPAQYAPRIPGSRCCLRSSAGPRRNVLARLASFAHCKLELYGGATTRRQLAGARSLCGFKQQPL